MGRKRLYHTEEERLKAARRWRKNYRDRIRQELIEYRRLKKFLAKVG
jgi:hypothetical protein